MRNLLGHPRLLHGDGDGHDEDAPVYFDENGNVMPINAGPVPDAVGSNTYTPVPGYKDEKKNTWWNEEGIFKIKFDK